MKDFAEIRFGSPRGAFWGALLGIVGGSFWLISDLRDGNLPILPLAFVAISAWVMSEAKKKLRK